MHKVLDLVSLRVCLVLAVLGNTIAEIGKLLPETALGSVLFLLVGVGIVDAALHIVGMGAGLVPGVTLDILGDVARIASDIVDGAGVAIAGDHVRVFTRTAGCVGVVDEGADLDGGEAVGAGGLAVGTHELLLGRGIVDAAELLLVGADLFGTVGDAAGKEVSADERDVGEEFARFGVGEEDGEEGAEVLDSFVEDAR